MYKRQKHSKWRESPKKGMKTGKQRDYVVLTVGLSGSHTGIVKQREK